MPALSWRRTTTPPSRSLFPVKLRASSVLWSSLRNQERSALSGFPLAAHFTHRLWSPLKQVFAKRFRKPPLPILNIQFIPTSPEKRPPVLVKRRISLPASSLLRFDGRKKCQS